MSQVTASPGTMADDSSTGDVAWTNPNNAQVSDGVYATYITYNRDTDSTTPSHYLKATNFGFAIPAGSTINGILVEVESIVSEGVQTFGNVRIVKGGNISTTTISGGTNAVTITEGYQSIPVSGASTYLWGESLLYSDINASTFGVVIQGNGGASPRTVGIDHIRITVYYTEATTSTSITTTSTSITTTSSSTSRTTSTTTSTSLTTTSSSTSTTVSSTSTSITTTSTSRTTSTSQTTTSLSTSSSTSVTTTSSSTSTSTSITTTSSSTSQTTSTSSSTSLTTTSTSQTTSTSLTTTSTSITMTLPMSAEIDFK